MDASSCDGLEFDEFDRPDTLYLAARGTNGTLTGTARLLPTHRPYLLDKFLPQLMGLTPMPRSPDIWGLSRFATLDLMQQTVSDQPFSSPIAIALLEAALSLAGGADVQRLITVSPLGVERLLRRAGFLTHRAAPPRVVHGHALFACWIETGRGGCDASAMTRCRPFFPLRLRSTACA